MDNLLLDELRKLRKEIKEHKTHCYEHNDLQNINFQISECGYIIETLKCNEECQKNGCFKCKEDITCQSGQNLNKELKELREAIGDK